MARQRMISSESAGPQEEGLNVALRPQRLSEMVGQRPVIEKLEIAITAALERGEPLEHVLLDGPPGLGKTTLAHVIANEMGGHKLQVTSGPAITKQGELMALLTNFDTGDVLFIDEIHRLPKVVEEFLYPAMEDFRVDFTIEGGSNAPVALLKYRANHRVEPKIIGHALDGWVETLHVETGLIQTIIRKPSTRGVVEQIDLWIK